MDRCVLLALVIAAAAPAAAYSPTGDLSDLYDFTRLARLRPGVKCKMISSYDRTGGNNDGFSGAYSRIRVENGNSVLAEMEGAGAIQRIWFTHSEHKVDGLLERKGEHIRVYLDGKAEAALDVPLADLFSGKLERFPAPLVGSKSGGFWCYVPIPYQKGCRVEVEGTAVRFYHITWSEFPSVEGVKTFSMTLADDEKEKLEKAVKAWTGLGVLEAAEPLPIKQTVSQKVKLQGTLEKSFPLVPGPSMVRALYLEVSDKDWPKWAGSRIRIRWDGADEPGVDLPAEYLFAHARGAAPYRSLLTGAVPTGNVLRFYNFFPMAYARSARVTISPPSRDSSVLGTFEVVQAPIEKWADDSAYAHAAYSEALPAQPKVYFPWLARAGQGHYAGTYMVTEGKGKLPLWLEGDEQFTVDGELRIHGTGTEDYFNFGWYAVENRLDRPTALPLSGFPIYKDQDNDTSRASAYRWHLADPVPYEKEIRAEIEHGGENEVPADYRGATFWYDWQPTLSAPPPAKEPGKEK